MYTDESLIAFCQRALQTPSFSGRERQMAELMKDKMLELGFDEAVFDRLGNVIGTIHGKRPGKTILMDGHIDTVDVIDEAQWTHGPFSGEIADGKIYGARRLGHEGQRLCDGHGGRALCRADEEELCRYDLRFRHGPRGMLRRRRAARGYETGQA